MRFVSSDVIVSMSCTLLVFRVADASAENKMNVSNLATTFGPVLFTSEAVSQPLLSCVSIAVACNAVVTCETKIISKLFQKLHIAAREYFPTRSTSLK